MSLGKCVVIAMPTGCLSSSRRKSHGSRLDVIHVCLFVLWVRTKDSSITKAIIAQILLWFVLRGKFPPLFAISYNDAFTNHSANKLAAIVAMQSYTVIIKGWFMKNWDNEMILSRPLRRRLRIRQISSLHFIQQTQMASPHHTCPPLPIVCWENLFLLEWMP